MSDLILLGDEAIAQGALDAGIRGAFSYPGTPATEILEYIIKQNPEGVHAKWSPNEKVAYEEALGLSYIGGRALISMKHVGLNVAADPFINSAFLQLNGAVVIILADDPGMHSSQNEQDSRLLADFTRIPCFEPRDQQECYDMTRTAFELSEEHRIPVMLRLTTRLAHSRSQIKASDPRPLDPAIRLRKNQDEWILAPSISPKLQQKLIEKIATLEKSPVQSYNHSPSLGGNTPLGIVTSGLGGNYVREALRMLDQDIPVYQIGFFPCDRTPLAAFVQNCREVLVIEEGYPYLEKQIAIIKSDSTVLLGRDTRHLPLTGELNPRLVQKAISLALGLKMQDIEPVTLPLSLPKRPPELCQGCSHRDTFTALKLAIADKPDAVVFGDIGCYTLGWLPPFQALDTTVNMGASISMAKGAAEGGLPYSIAVIGDSTFQHTGLNGLLGAAAADTPMTVVIFNNSTTGMTGGQPLIVDGEELRQLVLGLGANPAHVHSLTALPARQQEISEVLKKELEHRGLSVIISSRECIQTVKRSK